MSNQPFAFPPPPPPPPPQRTTSHNIGYGSTQDRGYGRGRGGAGSWRGLDGRGRGGNGMNQGQERPAYQNNYGDQKANYGGRGSAGRGYHGPGSRPRSGSFHDTQQGRRNSTQEAPNGSCAPPISSRYPHSRDLNLGAKRSHETAFSQQAPAQRRPLAAPAVPSFYSNIPELANNKDSSVIKNPKPRKSNQLGLTPTLNSQDSGSEDEDEEVKLAQFATPSGHQFEYRGQTSTLKSTTEIAAWIAERRRNYPTAAKAEKAKKEADERKKKWEDEKKAKQEAARRKREEEQIEREKQKHSLHAQNLETAKSDKTSKKERSSDTAKKAEKLQRKAEKAAKELEKAQRALRKAQARVDKASLPVKAKDDRKAAGLGQSPKDDSSAAVIGDENGASVQPLSRSPAPMELSKDVDSQADAMMQLSNDVGLTNDLVESSDSVISDISDSESTSSSGSHSTDEESDDSAPAETTSRQIAPIRVPPPKRENPRQPTQRNQEMCHAFARSGHCKFGRHCRHSHQKPPKTVTKEQKARRKGLFEVMVEKEKEQEREQMLRAIVALGRSGMLDQETQK